jgi:hypothetical protein
VEVPLVTVSLAVITSENLGEDAHPNHFGQLAAKLKKQVKTLSATRRRSCFLFDRRREGRSRKDAARS